MSTVPQRIEPEAPAPHLVVTPDELKSDFARGYAIMLFQEEGDLVIHNPRGGTIRRKQPQVLKYCCMRCKFDTVESYYPPAMEGGSPRTGLDIIRDHVFHAQHPWKFRPYETPYGLLGDVKIEGVEDYTEYLKETP